ncbi:MAG: M1 family metallopeptidase [Ignavibacteriaceae bacterium]
MNLLVLISIFILFQSNLIFSQLGSQDTGGPLSPEQAAYDVKYYNINLKIYPELQTIDGRVGVTVNVIDNIKELILDLDDRYRITKIVWKSFEDYKELTFKHEEGKIKIDVPIEINIGDLLSVEIHYNGKPRVAERPPWDDGFSWKKTKSGDDWIGVTCQGGGADIWWPCKDHPSDEPDSASLNFTIPKNLFCASNGQLRDIIDNKDGTKTFEWFVSTPINNYGISVNIAPYDTIQYSYASITGEVIPVTIWVLPESMEKARAHCPQYLDHLRFYEELLGPYPFRIDKYGVAETSYLGMEHQTVIANGFGYKEEPFGFDWLHHHELGHEWWGNMLTAKDWSDFWIHEATCGYMQALYLEEISGIEAYHDFLSRWRMWKNEQPIAPRKEMTGGEAYSYDMYAKGTSILHTLRYYLGKETFLKIMRRWAYPDPKMENIKTGAQCRFATTDEFLQIAEDVSGKKLNWYWEVYFRQASLPILNAELKEGILYLTWITENNISFYLPVEVKLGEKIITVSMNEGQGELIIPDGVNPVIDPDKWITMDEVIIVQ